MIIKKVTSLAPPRERRRFGRITVAEPRICHVQMPRSQEFWTDQSIVVNISLGGIYLICHRQPPIEKNDICYVTLDTPDSDTDNAYFRFHVSVVRAGETQLDHAQFGLGLKILSDPVYFSPHEENKLERSLLDKTKILYKYYDLNKKAYDIIINTPEIRTDKINNIKTFIDKGSYKVKTDKFTQRIINDMNLEDVECFIK
jgi:anti-sigma28 factor (negative regulator of flagellin synthesis)